MRKTVKRTKKTKDQDVGFNKKHRHIFFSNFAKVISDIVGNAISFGLACLIILVWLIAGPLFHFSDTWQLIINTATTIVTFLIVFLLQHTQNRDTEIINLKLDELIKGHKGAKNSIIDLTSLSDDELKELEGHYKRLCNKKTGK